MEYGEIINQTLGTNQDNISLNAFRTAINGSLSQFGMVDGIIDEYEDEGGIICAIGQPFAHMIMDDNTDSGSGANAVTDIGSPTYTAGHLGNSLTLGGSDALNLDALQADIASDTTGTIALWFNTDTIASTHNIVAFSEDIDNELIRIRLESGGNLRIGLNVNGGTRWQHQSTGSISVSTWFHIVVVQDGISPKIYLDGIDITALDNTTAITEWFNDAPGLNNARLGCVNFNAGGNTQFFDGQIDDFRYYQNQALTSEEVSTLYNLGVGTETSIFTGSSNISYDSGNDLYSPFKESIDFSPLVHYKMNDNAGNTVVIDSGTSGTNGVSQQNTSSLTTSGRINEALTFNGSSDFIDTVDFGTLKTVMCWFKTTNAGNTSPVPSLLSQKSNASEASGDWQFGLEGNGKINVQVYNATNDLATGFEYTHSVGVALNDNVFHHVAVVTDGSESRLYIDGILVKTASAGVTLMGQSSSEIVWVGKGVHNAGSPRFFDGQIDDVRLYTQALITSEIQAIYNSGTGTEADQPEGSPENMTLQSISFTAQAQSDNARIVLLQEDVDSVTLNTDLIASVSRDGGTTFTSFTLEDQGEYENNRKLLSASVDISSQPTGTDMVYKIESANNKDLKIHGSGLSWD